MGIQYCMSTLIKPLIVISPMGPCSRDFTDVWKIHAIMAEFAVTW